MFQAEGIARAKALRQKGTRHAERLAGRPAWLEDCELELGRAEEMRAEGPDGWSLVGCNEALALHEDMEVPRDLIPDDNSGTSYELATLLCTSYVLIPSLLIH